MRGMVSALAIMLLLGSGVQAQSVAAVDSTDWFIKAVPVAAMPDSGFLPLAPGQVLNFRYEMADITSQPASTMGIDIGSWKLSERTDSAFIIYNGHSGATVRLGPDAQPGDSVRVYWTVHAPRPKTYAFAVGAFVFAQVDGEYECGGERFPDVAVLGRGMGNRWEIRPQHGSRTFFCQAVVYPITLEMTFANPDPNVTQVFVRASNTTTGDPLEGAVLTFEVVSGRGWGNDTVTPRACTTGVDGSCTVYRAWHGTILRVVLDGARSVEAVVPGQ